MKPFGYVVVVVVAGFTVAGVASRASAYDLDTSASCPNGYTYSSDRNLTFNYSNIPTFAEQLQFLAAGPAVADRISNIGGHSFDFITPYGASALPFVFGSQINGLNEVGAHDLFALFGNGVGGYTDTDLDNATCRILEADVYIEDTTNTWYMPEYYGVPFYDAGAWVNGQIYGRTTLLHEMLHSVGLEHSATSYAFMNYNVFPWANRGSDDDMVDPLPDDREAMRDLYGNADTLTDVGVLTTWYDSTIVNVGAAKGKKLCKPSTGTAYSTSIFDATCGVDAAGASGSTEVCPGDTVYVRYAIVNYGTTDVTLDEELWFSRNDHLNRTAGFDIVSPTTKTAIVAAANSSYRKGRTYDVPSGLDWNTDYYPVLWLDTAGLAERSDQNNWIPLRTTIHVKPQASCP
jgi:hypothetical protein